jgi:hypothetical protein
MKIRHYATTIAAAIALSPMSFAGSTAKQAIATLEAAEGTRTSSNIFALTGRFGQDQPQEWEILAQRGDQFAMFIVDKKSVQSYSIVRPKKSPKLATKSLKVDSSKAFKIANKSAIAASISYDSLDYSLKPRSDSRVPVWIVSLVDVSGTIVGGVHIASDSGKVLLTNWDRELLNAPKRESQLAVAAGSRGIITDRRGASVQTGSTADGVREGLAQVGTSIRNVFRKEEVSTTPNADRPKTTKAKP